MDLLQAKKIMGKNLIGPDELGLISSQLGIKDPSKVKTRIPKINFSETQLKKSRKDYILILGVPKNKKGQWLTLNILRSHFGLDPKKSEPCFYNQDWYLKEKFAAKTHLEFQWYLVRKKVITQTRGKDPQAIQKSLNSNESLPSAILSIFTFFAYYFHTKGEILWKYDFIWCLDKDKNGDRIYTGRYEDPKKINKNGFNIHRHLSIRPCYGAVTQVL
ncbi:MAG: hypothetical protein Q8Q23_04670 [bacterium]|nr:hypothetical protein [bacterium]